MAPRPVAPVTASPVAAAPAEAADWSVPARYQGKLLSARVRYFPQKLLALTFDDGPDPTVTPQVLATLQRHQAHATFFVLGENATGHRGLLRQMLAEGHCIGSHGYTHAARPSAAQAARDLDRAAAVIHQATGRRPTLFRPPYGITTNEYTRLARQQGYAVVLWTISSADTRPVSAQVLADNVIHTPNPGDFVLMHDGSGHQRSAQALEQILTELGAAGFRFVTLPELLRAWDYWLTHRASVAPPGGAHVR